VAAHDLRREGVVLHQQHAAERLADRRCELRVELEQVHREHHARRAQLRLNGALPLRVVLRLG